MKEFNTFQRYFIEEFYDDYREGLISRRTFIRRLAFITGSMASVGAAMTLVGCQPIEIPAATEPMPEAEAAGGTVPSAESGAVPGAQSPLSVPEGDPDLVTEEITYASQDGDITAYLARPAAADTISPAVLVCHENRGLTPHIRDVARRFAKEGYVALAPDLLSREGGTATLDRDEIPGLLSNAPAERHVADFQAGYEYLQGLEVVDGERIAMNGFCFGGGVTWRCATSIPGLRAAAPFYGPAPDLAEVPNIQAAVFAVYGELDERINAGIPELEAALQAAGITFQIMIYPGVNHAFHNDTGERFDETQAVQAWNDMLGWFAAHV